MSFPRYDSYRDSGVEWLGEVPEHWGVVPLFAIAKECDRPNFGMIENNLLSLSYGKIVRKNIDDNDGLLPASFETYQIAEPNEIVWRLTDLQNDQRSLRTAITTERGIITSAYLLTRIEGAIPAYLAHLLRGYDQRKIFYSMGGGLRQGMKFSDVKRMPVPLPPPEEQAVVAAFLDRETAKIDGLIEEQRRLVVLLKEKRQAVISHAVTKGLNPSAPMKPSGIEWLGDVPAHWGIRTLNHVIDQFVDYRGATPNKVDFGVPLITATQIKKGRIDHFLDPVFISEEEYVLRMTRGFPERGDLLLTTEAPLGEVALIKDARVAPGQRIILMKTKKREMDSTYLLAHFQSLFGQSELITRSSGSTASGIRADRLRGSHVLLPPINEQLDIVEFITREIKEFEEVESQAVSAITLLQERRAALISAAVTGKIDVRGAVAAQPKLTLIQGGLDAIATSARIRLLVATQIVGRLAIKPTFGRTQLQKHLHLAQYHVGIEGIDGAFMREAAGPLDRTMLSNVEEALVFEGFATARQERQGYPVTYNLNLNRKTYRDEFVASVGADKANALTALLSDMADFNTQSVEAVSTLYAVWNDFLIDGITPTDEQLFHELATNWHPNKSIPRATLTNMLAWMRRKNVVPKGNGFKTIPTMTGKLI